MTKAVPRPFSLLSYLPYAVMAFVAVIDVVAGPAVGFLPLVSLGPAFAGLVGGRRRTALVGSLALVLCMALGWYDGRFPGRRGLTALASVAGVTAAGLLAAVMRQRREAELAGVRSIAEVAQRVLLRPVPRRAGHLTVAVSYTSAVAEARIGGDLYEVVASPAGVRVIVGDVQGKGLDAVETAALVLGAFREAAHDEPDLRSVGARLERAADRELRGEKFVTAVLAEVGDDQRVTLLNYGHPPPVVVSPDGTVRFAEPPRNALPPRAGHTRWGRAGAVRGGLRRRRPVAALHGRRHGGQGPYGSLLPARRAGRPAQGRGSRGSARGAANGPGRARRGSFARRRGHAASAVPAALKRIGAPTCRLLVAGASPRRVTAR